MAGNPKEMTTNPEALYATLRNPEGVTRECVTESGTDQANLLMQYHQYDNCRQLNAPNTVVCPTNATVATSSTRWIG